MAPAVVPQLFKFDQLHSSYLILVTVLGLALVAGVLYYIGFLGWSFGLLGRAVRWTIWEGFLLWKTLFAWATWSIFLAVVLTLLFVGWAASSALPGLTLVAGAVLLFMGATACLAFMFIDLERYEVERGYKAVHNPMKGQELAHHLVRFGSQVDVPLLAAAAIGIITGFALLNLGLYRGIGTHWYRVVGYDATFADFLAFGLINL